MTQITAAERFAEAKDRLERLMAKAIANPSDVYTVEFCFAMNDYRDAWRDHIGRWRRELHVEEDGHASAD